MRSIVCAAVILFSCHCLFAQQVVDFKSHKAVLFADTIKLNFSVDSLASRFTPSKNDAILAEEIITKFRQEFVKHWGRSFNSELRKSNRQFVGYNDQNDEKHVLVFLLNMNKSHADYYFETWSTKPVIGFGKFYEQNLKILNINLSRGRARIY